MRWIKSRICYVIDDKLKEEEDSSPPKFKVRALSQS